MSERFIMTIYVFLFPHGLKDHSINIKYFSNLIQEINGLFLFPGDSLIVSTTIMESERFMFTIYLFLFSLVLKDYSVNIKDLSNL